MAWNQANMMELTRRNLKNHFKDRMMSHISLPYTLQDPRLRKGKARILPDGAFFQVIYGSSGS
jgi:hypothetical protein